MLIPAWFGSRVLPVTQAIAERWGSLDAQRQMSAATALEHGLTVVTRNVKDFEGLGVPIINPWDAERAVRLSRLFLPRLFRRNTVTPSKCAALVRSVNLPSG